ncbi:serine hydrolase domain-containing protein [Actinocrispum wychmicini]|uniref:CubicO group peptidase (Beta-lactamase class C family) n=1 Tax=Actinocrispum wychmicini TaxID=1213861 RepID=A0A4R2J5V7_9PSEU|nr:serine hydrolase domain-containing protein [Actinocrispum wychmicini]TCO53754.1 CubicO group peptidase (beta-lactamase class C family) [Actinocrispum wychmicini]
MICDPAFAAVDEAFCAGLDKGGAALTVIARGRVLVDIWGGAAAEGRPWEHDTVANVFSVTKGVLAAVANVLIQRGELRPDAPVRAYWPQFTTDVTVAELLSHQAGLAALSEPSDIYDWQAMTDALTGQKPWWPPGSAHGYHAVTFGWLAGELVRRASGRELDTLVADLGVPDLWIGLPRTEWHRAADLPPPEAGPVTGPALFAAMSDANSLTAKAFVGLPDLLVPGVATTDAWREARIPAANGHATARALATMYAQVLDGDHTLATTAHSDGPDLVLHGNTRFGLGFMLPNEVRPFAPNPTAFGHSGAGGALAFADPDAGLALGFTTNRLITSAAGPDPRWVPILGVLYQRI